MSKLNKTRSRKITFFDQKTLKPKDTTSTGIGVRGIDKENIDTKMPNRPNKTVIGRPRVYDLKGNLLADEENLVVLVGREFIAQQLAGTTGDNPNNYTNYKIKYFGVGDGGTTNDCPPTTVGPYDDDTDLVNRVVIKDPAVGLPPDYIDGGKLKRIEVDGEISIVNEEHTINTGHGGQMVVHAYTAIKFVMYLQPDEPRDKNQAPFRFNEAGLYAVEYDSNGNPTDNYILFARFTTLDKYLEDADGLMIEWYILV